MCDQVGGKAPGSVGTGQAGECRQQRAVVLERFGHLVVEAFVVLGFGSVVAEPDPFGDQDPCAGLAVVVPK